MVQLTIHNEWIHSVEFFFYPINTAQKCGILLYYYYPLCF